jgi:hypothetical protein
VPSLGFVHDSGTLPFIYDVADLYKRSPRSGGIPGHPSKTR